MVNEEWSKVRGSWKLPADVELQNTLVKISNDFQVPYSTAKRLVLTGVLGQPDVSGISKSFGEQAQGLEQFLRGGVLKGIKQAEDGFAKEVQLEIYKTKFDKLYGFVKNGLEDNSIRRKTAKRTEKALQDFETLKNKLGTEAQTKGIKDITPPEELASVMDTKALTILKAMREDVSDNSPKAFVIDKQIERLEADRKVNAEKAKARDIGNIKKSSFETAAKLFDLNPELKSEHLFTAKEFDFSKSKSPEESKKLFEQFTKLREESDKLNEDVVQKLKAKGRFGNAEEENAFRQSLRIIEANLAESD